MNAVTVDNLTKKYKEHLAVDHISFEVGEGEFFAFLGENGAGKSTTINMLCTILEKSDGQARIFDCELGRDDDEIRKKIGIVFQNSVLDDKLTVSENLYTRASYYGLGRKEADRRLEPFMEGLELKEIWNRRYEKLSGGQRRRVDIIRALLNDPKILFLDEPTTGLDPMSRRLVWDYIDYLRRDKHMTIFLTTHYMEEVRDADHVVILDRGKVAADDTPAGLKNKYTHTRLLWYADANAENNKVLAGLSYIYEADHYIASLPAAGADITGKCRDLGADTFDLTDFLYRNRSHITDYEVLKGSMDDVFLNLTGRKMGE